MEFLTQIDRSNNIVRKDGFSEQIKIKTGQTYETEGTTSVILAINSEDRDFEKYPNISNYIIDLENTYKDIVNFELVAFNSNAYSYNVNCNNNRFYVQESFNGCVEINLRIGNYNREEFMLMLEEMLNESSLQSRYYVKYKDEKSNNLIIESDLNGGDNLFQLIFKYENKILKSAKLLGFDYYNYGSYEILESKQNIIYTCKNLKPYICCGDKIILRNNKNNRQKEVKVEKSLNNKIFVNENLEDNYDIIVPTKIYSIYPINLDGDINVILRMKGFENIESTGKYLNGAFTVIPLPKKNERNYVDTLPYFSRKVFNPPLGKLNQLDIQFLNSDGSYYDFANREHILVFKIIMLHRPEFSTVINNSI